MMNLMKHYFQKLIVLVLIFQSIKVFYHTNFWNNLNASSSTYNISVFLQNINN